MTDKEGGTGPSGDKKSGGGEGSVVGFGGAEDFLLSQFGGGKFGVEDVISLSRPEVTCGFFLRAFFHPPLFTGPALSLHIISAAHTRSRRALYDLGSPPSRLLTPIQLSYSIT